VKKAMAVMLDDLEESQFVLTAKAKQRRMNDPEEFANIALGELRVEVVYQAPDERTGAMGTFWGMAAEQAKIDLNTASTATVMRLIVEVLGWGGAEAQGLAEAITDWRDYGQHDAEGFFSDDYYQSLEFPYAMKDRPFERIDELLLVKGVDRDIYEALLPFVTVYGDGRVDINTASKKVLVALGLDGGVADKVLRARRGADNVEATADDHIFARTFDVAAETAKIVPLEHKDARQIDELNAQGLLTTGSSAYSLVSRVLGDHGYQREIMVIFSALDSRILYWYEK
jgi:hypothetical protein